MIEGLKLVYMDHDTMRKLQGQLPFDSLFADAEIPSGENCGAHEDATMTSLEKVQVESQI